MERFLRFIPNDLQREAFLAREAFQWPEWSHLLSPANATSSLCVAFSLLFLFLFLFHPRRILLHAFRLHTGVSSRERSRARPKITEAARPTPNGRPCGDSTMTEALSVSLRLPLRAVLRGEVVSLVLLVISLFFSLSLSLSERSRTLVYIGKRRIRWIREIKSKQSVVKVQFFRLYT